MRRRTLPLLVVVLLSGCASFPPPPAQPADARAFRFSDDTFSFANETVWNYRDGSRVPEDRPGAANSLRYSRRCFVLAAAAVQFWKYARFDPHAPRLAPAELARRVREVTAQAAWGAMPRQSERIVFSGYSSLRELSAREGGVLRANLGAGWTTYFHFRKQVMVLRPSATHQQRVNEQLQSWLAARHPMVLWLYNFPHINMNHAVVAFAAAGGEPNAYLVYDPNYTDSPRVLRYDPQSRSFSFPKTFYFGGGSVLVRPVYLGLLR